MIFIGITKPIKHHILYINPKSEKMIKEMTEGKTLKEIFEFYATADIRIDVDVIIDAHNANNPDARQIDRTVLAELTEYNKQVFSDWKGGKVPKLIRMALAFMHINNNSLDFIAVVLPPKNLSYDKVKLAVGQADVNVSPETDGVCLEYTIEPELPRGLGINKSTGRITGTPKEAKEKTVYTVTATNTQGSCKTSFPITVKQ
jgi:hypothetical protein